MNPPVLCEKCGTGFSPMTVGGLCPRCLIHEGLDDGRDAVEPAYWDSETIQNRFVGDYVLLKEIARGGMGVVYKARQHSLGRVVAIKMLLAGEFAGEESVRRFRAEATATARLQHPNIVAIHEVGECDGLPFLCMDYVDGPNLAELIREHPLPAREAASHLKTIAEAVEYAHAQGLLHRDLKPSNVLIDPFGEPRVTDFGLAKDFGENGSQTRTGHLAGTLGYMPPEQADARRGFLSPASDVYSLGAVLYHLITGRAPFAAGSLHETLQQLLSSEPIAPRLLNDGVPRDLETICLRCLAKEPSRRYARAQDLADELGRFLEGRPIQARPISAFEKLCFWCRRQPALAALSGAVFCLLLALAIGATVAAVRIGSARDAEARHRARAEQSVTQFELQRADDLLREGKVSPGLAYLAHVLRRNPTNRVAAARILSVLTRRSFGLPAGPPLVHDARISMAVFSPEGGRVATASADGTARIWDVETGKPLTGPLRHQGSVIFSKFTPAGSQLFTASKDGNVCRWNAETGELMGTPLTHDAPVEIAETSRDGRVIATVAGAFTRAWDAVTGRLIAGPWKHGGRIACLDVSYDGRYVTTGGLDSTVRVWDTLSDKLVAKIQHPARVRFVEFSPNADRVVTASDDGRARVWEIPSGKRLTEVAHRTVLERAVFSPDGTRIATASRDATARIWDAASGEPISPPLRHYSVVDTALFSADGIRLLTKCWDNTAWVWDARTGELMVQPLKHEDRVNWAAFSPDGQQVITASEDRTTQVWDVRYGKESMLRFHQESGAGIVLSPDGSRVLIWSGNGALRVWNSRTGQPLTEPFRHQAGVISATFSPDGSKVATASFDKTAVVWEAASGKRLTTFAAHSNVVEFVEFSPDGQSLITAGREGTARVWDAASGQPLSPPLRHELRIWQAHFSKDGQRIVTCSDDGTARVWETASGQPIGQPLQHQAGVSTCMFSPDGERVVTASFDMTARIWHIGGSRPATPPLKHYGVLRHAEFSSDGKRVITASGDNTAQIWDAATGRPMGESLHHQSEVWRACFSPDGELAATISLDGTARVWDAHTGQPITEPIGHGSGWSRVSFSPNGRRLALSRSDLDAFLCELPDYHTPPPAWLTDLAEAVASQKVRDSGNLDFVSPNELLRLKSALANATSSDHWSGFARWFFADRTDRRISPFSDVTVPELVSSLVKESTADSLLEALKLAPDNQEARWRAARRAFHEQAPNLAFADLEKDTFHRWVRGLPEAAWPEAEKWEDTDLPRAVAAMLRASARPPPIDPSYWLTQGRIFARTNKHEDALGAFSQAVELTRTDPGVPGELRTMALVGRRNLLLQLHRRDEALADAEVPLRIPTRDPRADSRLVDLSDFYNAALAEPWHQWSRSKNNLSLLSPGILRMGGVEFDVRGVIQLAGLYQNKAQPGYPRQVKGIPLSGKCERLSFIHATGWGGLAPMGVVLGSYRVHYADGREETIPLVNGEDLYEWFNIPGVEKGLKRASIAWRGRTPEGSAVRLFKRSWENPRPDETLVSLDFISNETAAAPFLIAVTAED